MKIRIPLVTSERGKKMLVAVFISFSFIFNIVFLGMLFMWVRTPAYDSIAFKKSLPSICSAEYQRTFDIMAPGSNSNELVPVVNPERRKLYDSFLKGICDYNSKDSDSVKNRLRLDCASRRNSLYYPQIYKYTCESQEYWAPGEAPNKPK